MISNYGLCCYVYIQDKTAAKKHPIICCLQSLPTKKSQLLLLRYYSMWASEENIKPIWTNGLDALTHNSPKVMHFVLLGSQHACLCIFMGLLCCSEVSDDLFTLCSVLEQILQRHVLMSEEEVGKSVKHLTDSLFVHFPPSCLKIY